MGYAYAEYRGQVGNSFYESTAYIGAAYCIYSKHEYLALEPLAIWKTHKMNDMVVEREHYYKHTME